ncbi:MAG: methyltransferase [Bacteroidetes Order II. Incertae sedis bacterium]|nr:methyltransferase [Bacteroidetes Order II. bacterium]
MGSGQPYDPNLNPVLRHRYENTLRLLQERLPAPARILDIGSANPLSEHLKSIGYDVINTSGDLDEDLKQLDVAVDAVTAFEILEHLVSPMPLLRALNAPLFFATVPMRLWFASAYKSKTDHWDRHYHEFEDWQFDWLLEKGGWHIVHSEQWTSPTGWLGFRPILRQFTPRYYAVVAERATEFKK